MTKSPSVARPESVLAVTTLGLFLIMLNSSSVNVALPEISGALHAPTGVADWFLLGFMVANTASILVFGRLSDLLGRRRIYLAGMSVFVLASIAAAFAPTAAILIALRVLQGVAGATIVTNSTALLADAFPKERLAGALGVNISAAAVANTIGPTIGGLLVESFGWQAVFLVNVPFGIASVLLGMRVIPHGAPVAPTREPFHLLGAVLSVSGLTLVLVAVSRLQEDSITDPVLAGTFVAGIGLLVWFVLVSLRTSHPLIDVRLVLDRARGFAYGAAFFNSFSRAGVVVLVVLFEQMVGGTGATAAGLVVMSLAVGMAVASPIAGRLTGRFSARTLSSAGGLLLTGSLAALTVTLPAGSIPLTVVLLLLAGLGVGVFTAPNTSSIMHGVAPSRRAVANAVRSVLFNSAQVLGTTVTLLLVTASGVSSYAVTDASPGLIGWFRVALGVLAASAAVSVVLSFARGGSWRAAPAAAPAPAPTSLTPPASIGR
jgi:EmrB/QacA subfamily drug resistance transporter